jgi:hypothetical protein
VICVLETKTKVGSIAAKAPAPCTHPNIDEAPTAPKSVQVGGRALIKIKFYFFRSGIFFLGKASVAVLWELALDKPSQFKENVRLMMFS